MSILSSLNSAPRLIRNKNLNFEGDELTVVDCTQNGSLRPKYLIIQSLLHSSQ